MLLLTKKTRVLLCLTVSLVVNFCLYAIFEDLRNIVFMSFGDALKLTALITGTLFVVIMPLFKILSENEYSSLIKMLLILELPIAASKIITDAILTPSSLWYIPLFLLIAILVFDTITVLIVALNCNKKD